jgi:spore germination protein KA
MSFWSRVSRIFTVDDSILDERFSLGDRDEDDDREEREEQAADDQGHQSVDDKENEQEKRSNPRDKKTFVKPIPLQELKQQELDKKVKKREKERQRTNEDEDSHIPEELYCNLQENRKTIEAIFRLPRNKDVVVREFTIASGSIRCFAVFVDGLSDKKVINFHLLEPLMVLSNIAEESSAEDKFKRVKEELLPSNQVSESSKWVDVKNGILAGSTAVFIDGVNKAIVMETKGWEHRSVSQARTESVVIGPQDAFTENFRANTGLVRARLRSERLVTEMMQVGKLGITDVAIMYIDGLTNPKLVREVKRRIKAIDVDFIQDSGILGQFIEDSPINIVPKIMLTERPDRVASFLVEGHVAIFVGQSPFVLIVPALFWSMLHTSEDAFIRWPLGTFSRLIRFVSLVFALLLPSFYIALTNYHPEMIPTDLMLAISASRERVPFPVVFEVLLMELSLEFIREAGIRIPSVIGPTIGIVGALILGQAAVQAGIISPLLVVAVAVTALASFTIPNQIFAFSVRVLRFMYLMLAAVYGFYGVALGVMVSVMFLSTIYSFGVPYLSPITPYRRSSADVVIRGKVMDQKTRNWALRPLDTRRQGEYSRPWDPMEHDSKEARRASEKKNTPNRNQGDES